MKTLILTAMAMLMIGTASVAMADECEGERLAPRAQVVDQAQGAAVIHVPQVGGMSDADPEFAAQLAEVIAQRQAE